MYKSTSAVLGDREGKEKVCMYVEIILMKNLPVYLWMSQEVRDHKQIFTVLSDQ